MLLIIPIHSSNTCAVDYSNPLSISNNTSQVIDQLFAGYDKRLRPYFRGRFIGNVFWLVFTSTGKFGLARDTLSKKGKGPYKFDIEQRKQLSQVLVSLKLNLCFCLILLNYLQVTMKCFYHL